MPKSPAHERSSPLHFRDQIAIAICEAVGVPIQPLPKREAVDDLCVPVVDLNEFQDAFATLSSDAPEVIEDIVAFLGREGATYETGRRIVDYLLVVADSATGDAKHLVTLRFRDAQERLAARAALYGKSKICDSHELRSLD